MGEGSSCNGIYNHNHRGELGGSNSKSKMVASIPVTIILFLVAYMDRVNIGFAIAGGMNKELGLTATGSGLAAGVFYWGYLLLQVPAGHFAEHRSAKRFIAWTILGWGGISLLSGFVQSAWQLYALRFLLGVAEGGVGTSILVLISKWFPQKEQGRAYAAFHISLPLAAALTNPISGWVVERWGWRGLFYFEGIASLGLIFVWWPLMSDTPEDAKWLSKAEKEDLLKTIAEDRANADAKLKAQGRTKWSYGELLRNRSLWILVLVYLCYNSGSLGYLIWLPTLLKNLTKMSLTSVGWLSALPLVAGVAGVYGLGVLSDRKGNRRLWAANALWGFSLAYWMSTLFPVKIWIAYGLIVVAGFFAKSIQGPFWPMPSLVFPPGVSGGARGIINGVANLGGFVGPVLLGWFTTRTGSMNSGIFGLAMILIIGGAISMLMPKVCAGYKYQEEAKAAGKA